MKYFGEFLFLFLIFCANALTSVTDPILPSTGVVAPDNNKYMDPTVDYESFMGRVTDKDDTGRVLKIKVENNNSKFLKAGDKVKFKVNNQSRANFCKASVKAVENFYFTVYVDNFNPCWRKGRYFPRGLQLNFKAGILPRRVFEASKFRQLLVLRKEGFLKQLNNINNFIWTYDQQKLKTAANYDIEINTLMREKQLAMDNLIQKKQESITLQNELIKKLDSVDESLKYYKVERQEYLIDRWNMDHDAGLPVGQRPQQVKRK